MISLFRENVLLPPLSFLKEGEMQCPAAHPRTWLITARADVTASSESENCLRHAKSCFHLSRADNLAKKVNRKL